MKKFILSILIILTTALPVSAEFFKDIIVTSPNGIWTDSRAYSTLNDAVTTIGASIRTITIPSIQTVTDLTVPSNVTLRFERDGSIANSGQLTIQTTKIEAGNRQIFTGVGDIDFASGSIVKSSWFSSINEALDVTSDDTLTLVITATATTSANTAVGNNVTLRWESPFIIVSNTGHTVSNIKNIEAGNYQLFAGAGDFDFLDGTSLHSSWFASLHTLLAWVETERVSVTISGNITVSNSDTVPSNIILDFTEENGRLSLDAGVTLTVYSPRNLKARSIQQIKEGTGTLAFSNSGPVYPDYWQFNTTPGTTDMTAAIASAIASGSLEIRFNEQIYAYTAISITAGATYDGLSLKGDGGRSITELRYTPAIGNGITFAGETNSVTISNFLMTSPANSTGAAIYSNQAVVTPLRDLLINNVSITGFLSGIIIQGGINCLVRGGRQTGQGSGVAGGVGITFGEDVTHALNNAIAYNVYPASYETGIYAKYANPISIDATIIGDCINGYSTDFGKSYLTNMYFDTNTNAIVQGASAYIFYNAHFGGVGNAISIASHRVFAGGYLPTRVVAMRVAAWNLNSAAFALVPLDTEEEDSADEFSTVTSLFTAVAAGYYHVSGIIAFTATLTGQTCGIALYVNAGVMTNTDATFHSSSADSFGGGISRTIWLDVGDTVSLYASTSANLAIRNAVLSINSIDW